MIPITEVEQTKSYQHLAMEMMTPEQPAGFNSAWLHSRSWKVVPVEDTAHLADEEIDLIVPALNRSGFAECLAVATEFLGPAPICYRLPISFLGLSDFNKECGAFRYVLTDEKRSWAIACNEWYNLYAGPIALLEAMLGKSIDEARQEFESYAKLLSNHGDKSLLDIGRYYAAL